MPKGTPLSPTRCETCFNFKTRTICLERMKPTDPVLAFWKAVKVLRAKNSVQVWYCKKDMLKSQFYVCENNINKIENVGCKLYEA